MTFKIKSMTTLMIGIIAFCLTAAISYAAPVTQVTVIKTSNPTAYIQKLKEGQAILTKMNSQGKLRAWQATIAGGQSGNIVVAVEWADMAAFAADNEKIQSSEEWSTWIASLGSIRSILSVSLYTEIELD